MNVAVALMMTLMHQSSVVTQRLWSNDFVFYNVARRISICALLPILVMK